MIKYFNIIKNCRIILSFYMSIHNKYFKILNNHVDVEKSDFFSSAHNSYGTRGHNLKLKRSAFGNNCFENIFANRCVSCWNWLPDEMVNSPSVFSFRRKLNNIDLSIFLKKVEH